MTAPFTAIVLAAQRVGVKNPVAEAHGVSHKCLAPIAGKPLIRWVADALTETPGLRVIRIVVEREVFEELGAMALGPIELVEAHSNLVDSVLAGTQRQAGPYIITTADNVLLTPAAAARMLAAIAGGADVTAMLATKASVLAIHPEAQRGFYAFADDEYANCNLYGIRDANALKAAEVFRQGGQFMKNPKRLAAAFGLLNILLVRFKLVSLSGAMKRLSRRFGLRFEALVPEDGAQAIDVDNERTYRIAESVLLARGASV